jgi:hypothetical protein
MRRTFSRSGHLHIFLAVLAMLFFAGLAARGQSLGDIARENREKKAADGSATPPKVITNANLPKDPEADESSSKYEVETQAAASSADAVSSKRAAEQRATEQRAQQWKRRILAQQNTIANLRMRVDRLKASIYFMNPTAGDSINYEAYAYNRYQARQLERLAQLQEQLAQQRAKLEDMQEAARKAGMHTAVYDP